jgi:hypothetical protein
MPKKSMPVWLTLTMALLFSSASAVSGQSLPAFQLSGFGLVPVESATGPWQLVPQSVYGPFYVVNAHSKKCLEIQNFYTHDAAPAQQWGCVGNATQKWWLEVISADQSTAQVHLINYNSGKCLEVQNFYTHNGARAQQWTCVSNATQAWTAVPSCANCPDRAERYRNRNSGRCLEIESFFTHDGALAQQWDCVQNATQTWSQPMS